MPELTPTAPAAGVQPSAPPDLSDPDQLESFAEGLMDRIVANDNATTDPVNGWRREQPESPEQPEAEKPEEQKAEGEQEQPEAKADEKAEPKQEEEGEEYADLDDYLGKSKLDRESFMAMPVKVTVDGKEDSIPLAELVKGHELKQASYARMQEAARQRTEFETERGQVRQALGIQIQRVEGLVKAAQDQLMGDYGQVTQAQLNELRAKDPGQYAAFIADYNARVEGIKTLMQQVDATRQEQARVADTQRRASMAQEMQKLTAARPEWRDPAKAQAAQTAMRTLGKQLGFSEAELNGIYDHRYMLVLDLAARQLQLQASQSATLKRVRSAPRMAKPGTRQTADPKTSAYQQARDAFARNPDDTETAAALFEHFAR